MMQNGCDKKYAVTLLAFWSSKFSFLLPPPVILEETLVSRLSSAHGQSDSSTGRGQAVRRYSRRKRFLNSLPLSGLAAACATAAGT